MLWKTLLFFLLLLALGTLLLLRFLNEEKREPEQTPVPPEQPYSTAVPEPPLPSPVPEAETYPKPDAESNPPEENEVVTLEDDRTVSEGKRYSEYTYGLVTDMVYTWRHRQTESAEEVASLLEELKLADPELGKVWEGIMSTWIHVDTDLELHYGEPPEGLPEDDSLCIVALGYQLKPDGSMTEELIDRCKTALRCAEKYPNAYVAVTGGGTASMDRNATEADAMAAWMAEHGVNHERLIIENTSMTTLQNARKTCSILAERYPQVEQVVIVTSDYHIPLGTLLFNEAAILYEYENGFLPYTVVSNATFAIVNTAEHLDIGREAQDLWSLADPQY